MKTNKTEKTIQKLDLSQKMGEDTDCNAGRHKTKRDTSTYCTSVIIMFVNQKNNWVLVNDCFVDILYAIVCKYRIHAAITNLILCP